MLISWEGAAVVKRPKEDADVLRLRHEAEMLAAARHSGVVSLLETGEDPSGPWMKLVGVGGPSLAAALAAPREGVEAGNLARMVGAVATTVADLHDLGLVHGGIDTSHVILDEARRPVLCSLGRGGKVGQLDPSDDVRALGALLEAVLPPGGPRTELSALADEAQAGRRKLTARALADSISKLAPDSSLSDARVLRRQISSDHRSLKRPPMVKVIIGAALVVGLVTGSIAVATLWSSPGRPVSARSHTTTTPLTRPVITARRVTATDYSGGILTFGGMRYTVGQPGDRVAVGRWSCKDPAPAVLDTDGRVYVFDGWATPDHDIQARLLSQVSGAGWLQTQPRAGGAGCDDLVVGGGPNGAVVLRPSSRS